MADSGTLAGWDDELQDWTDANADRQTTTSDNVYLAAAEKFYGGIQTGIGLDADISWLARRPHFRAAVDAARAPLLARIAELERLLGRAVDELMAEGWQRVADEFEASSAWPVNHG